MCGKISAVAHLATMPYSKSVESSVLLILMLSLKVQEADTKKHEELIKHDVFVGVPAE